MINFNPQGLPTGHGPARRVIITRQGLLTGQLGRDIPATADKLISMREPAAQMRQSLILVTGEEGAGKSTIMSALLPHTPAMPRSTPRT